MTDVFDYNPSKKIKLNNTFFPNNLAFSSKNVSNKAIEYPGTTKMGKLHFKLEEQIEAKNIFTCDLIVRTLDNIINEYYYDIMIAMFEKDDTPLSNDEYSLSKKRRYDDTQTGGELNTECVENTLWCLNYGIADSLHDFGKGRNGIFPQFAKTKNRAFDFLQISEEFLTINYNEKAPGTIISAYDKLYPYYSSSPGNFEDVIKDDFLLGNICGDVDNMYYYFSENNMPGSWGSDKKKYFELNPPNQINPFFEKLKIDGYSYCILDACMSIQKESEWQNNITMLKSLCNLWDPVGAGSLTAKEIVDGQTSMGLKLVLESTVNINNTNSYIYDSQTISESQSMYDYVYDYLFNQHGIPDFKFKLRLASEKQHDTSSSTGLSTSSDINFYISLRIQYKTEPFIYVIIPSGGFSVKILSYGLYFIETGDDYEIPAKQVNEYRILKQIIEYIQSKMANSSMKPLAQKNYLYNIILRFKSSGDHGSARTTKFFNDILKQKTLYLSGDRLAYVYSIAENIPTVSRYYAASSANATETDDDNDESCDRVHFLGVLLPEYDQVITAKNKLDEILAYLESISTYTPDNTETNLDVLNKNLLQFNDKLKEQISDMNVNTLDTIGIFSSIAISNGILLPQLKKMRDIMNDEEFSREHIEQIKKILATLKEYHDNVFYIKNYADIQLKIKKTIESQIKELNKIIEINAREITDISKPVEAINVRSSRNNASFRPITWIKNLLTTNKQITTSAEFIELLKNTQDSESKTFYDKIRKTKDNFLSKITDLTLYMKEKYGNSAPFIVNQSKEIMRVYNDKITSKLKQDTSPVGKTIMNIFGFASEPVVAVPIEDDDVIMNIIDLNDKKISKSTKEKIKDKATRAMKSVVSVFSGRESVLSKKRKLIGGSRKKRQNITHRKINGIKNKQTRKQNNKIICKKYTIKKK